MTKLQLDVDVWSDIACPWCYVGKRRLEKAIAGFAYKDAVRVAWHTFELDPSAPREAPPVTYAQRLARKYGMSVTEAEKKLAHMTELAKGDGLDLRFDRIRPGNTFDAHRLVHLAGERNRQDAVKERLLSAYLTEGEHMANHDTLVRLAGEAGLDADEVRATLGSDRYADEVRADEREAAELGIHGVPFFVFGGRYAVSGAQPAEVLRGALERAWSDVTARPAALAEGAACGPDGCE